MKAKKKFTDKQIKDWEAYEEVRQEGEFNMLDPTARAMTGLERDEYSFCMKNYVALREQAQA